MPAASVSAEHNAKRPRHFRGWSHQNCFPRDGAIERSLFRTKMMEFSLSPSDGTPLSVYIYSNNFEKECTSALITLFACKNGLKLSALASKKRKCNALFPSADA
jgi:hypothetical protein